MNNMRKAAEELKYLKKTNPALAEKLASEILDGLVLEKQAASFADAMHAQGMSQEELEKHLQDVAFKNDPAGAVSKRGKKVVDDVTGAVLDAGDAIAGGARGAVDWAKANPGKAGLIGGGIVGAGAGTAALINAIRNSSDEKVAAAWADYIEKFACAVLDEKLANEAAGEILKRASAEDPNFLDRLIGNVKFENGDKNLMDDHGYALLATMLAAAPTSYARAKGKTGLAQATQYLPMATGIARGTTAGAANDVKYGLGDAIMNGLFNPFSTAETRTKKHLREQELEDMRNARNKEAGEKVDDLLKQAGLFSSKDEREKARAIRQAYMNADNGDTGSVMKDQLMAEYEDPADFGAFDETFPGGKLNRAKVKEVINAVRNDPRYAETLDRLDTDSSRALAGLGLGLLTGVIGGGALGGKLGGELGMATGIYGGGIGGSVLGTMAAQAMNAKNIADIDPALIQTYGDRYNTEVPAKIEEVMGQGTQGNLNVSLGLDDYLRLKATKGRAMQEGTAQGQTGNY